MEVTRDAKYTSVIYDTFFFKNVDAVCEELKTHVKRSNSLITSPVFHTGNTPPVREDGLELTLSLNYYIRARFLYDARPILVVFS